MKVFRRKKWLVFWYLENELPYRTTIFNIRFACEIVKRRWICTGALYIQLVTPWRCIKHIGFVHRPLSNSSRVVILPAFIGCRDNAQTQNRHICCLHNYGTHSLMGHLSFQPPCHPTWCGGHLKSPSCHTQFTCNYHMNLSSIVSPKTPYMVTGRPDNEDAS